MARECGWGGGFRRGLGDSAPARLGGSAGLARRWGARALRRAQLALRLRGLRAEGGTHYPDVRSPGLSGGGGEAALAAITRETAPSWHQPAVLLFPVRAASLAEAAEAPFFPEAPGSHKWAQRAHPGAGAPDTPIRGHSRAPPTSHSRTLKGALRSAQAPPHGHEGAQNPDASEVLRESPNPSPCLQAGPNLSPPRTAFLQEACRQDFLKPPELFLQKGVNPASKRPFATS